MSEEDDDGETVDGTAEVDILAAAEALESSEKSEEAAEEAEAEDAPKETPESADDEDLTSLTVVELKTRLKSAGKPVSGKKDELIARLQE